MIIKKLKSWMIEMVMVIQCWSQREQQKIMKSVRTPAKKKSPKTDSSAKIQKEDPKRKDTLRLFTQNTPP